MSSPASAQRPLLLLGVHAWPNLASERRRHALRLLSDSTSAGSDVEMRFIMPATYALSPEDRSANDILHFRLPGRPAKAIQKFLLAHAFLRHALQRPCPPLFIGRSEDDT